MNTSSSTRMDHDTFSLRAWPGESSGAQPPLSLLIDRINSQKGSFRNISEKGLRDEIRNTVAGGVEVQDGASKSADDDADEKPRKEQLLSAKEDIAKLAAQAFNDSAHTLDFISLLLSKYTPKHAEMTISPFLKQNLPSGSLGSEELELPEQSESQNSDNGLVSFGWKLQSLSASADALLNSASNLKKEMEKEAKYWEQVLAVKEKGWSVCRLPRERHTLGVRYGFLEAPPEFRDKGLAALRRSDNGTIDLDLGSNTTTSQFIRVRIMVHGEAIAATQAEAVFIEDLSAEPSILQARNSLFDEELFHEMYREARTLTNTGVKCISEGISVPLEDGVSMLIDLTDRSETFVQSSDGTLAKKYRNFPQVAATALRILLSHSHRQAYIRRTHLPAPLTERKMQRPVPAILRPILSHFQHRSSLKAVEEYLKDLHKVFGNANLDFSYQSPGNSLEFKRVIEAKDLTGSSQFVNAFVSAVCAPIQSSISVVLGWCGAKFTISLRSHAVGTEHRIQSDVDSTTSLISQTPEDMLFSSAVEMQEHLSHLMMLGLVSSIEKNHPKWRASSPDEGELTTEETLDGDFEMLSIWLSRDCLELRWNATDEGEGEEEDVTWTKSSRDHGQGSGFFEEVGRFSAKNKNPTTGMP